MNKYTFFNEFRKNEIFGEDYEDALLRKKEIQFADKFIPGIPYPDNKIVGAIKKISKVISIKESDETGHLYKNGSVSCRGNKKYFSALVEFDDKTISEIDATVEEW
jgi:hypothetical protein